MPKGASRGDDRRCRYCDDRHCSRRLCTPERPLIDCCEPGTHAHVACPKCCAEWTAVLTAAELAHVANGPTFKSDRRASESAQDGHRLARTASVICAPRPASGRRRWGAANSSFSRGSAWRTASGSTSSTSQIVMNENAQVSLLRIQVSAALRWCPCGPK